MDTNKSFANTHSVIDNSIYMKSGSREGFFENGLKSRFTAFWNGQLGQNWVKISKRINPIMASSGFTNKYKKREVKYPIKVFNLSLCKQNLKLGQ